jgi:hypothetical protein
MDRIDRDRTRRAVTSQTGAPEKIHTVLAKGV